MSETVTVPAPAQHDEAPHALELEDLDVVYRVRGSDRQVLRGVTLTSRRGEAYGLVGESGCGKSTAALAIVNYLPRNGRVRSGGIRIDGRDALALSGAELRELRSNAVSMVYQNPGAALNPSIRVGKQVAEVFRARGASASDATDQAREALARVQIADPGSVMGRYSAPALGRHAAARRSSRWRYATDPALLILDEPTTGLDATVEAEVLDLIAGLRVPNCPPPSYSSATTSRHRARCATGRRALCGEMIEEGPAHEVLAARVIPTRSTCCAVYRAVGRRKDHGLLDTIPGFHARCGTTLPGCVFAARCPFATDLCRSRRRRGRTRRPP